MQGKYECLSTFELREMLLNNTLNADVMTFDDYERLFRHEIKSKNPNGKVVSFCSETLNKFDKYNRDVKSPSFDEITQRSKQQKRVDFSMATRRITKMAAIIVVCVIVASVLVQTVSLALGYNFFGFIRNWLREDDVSVSLVEKGDDGVYDLNKHRQTTPIEIDSTNEPPPVEDEFVFLDFNSVEDIPDEWLARVPDVLLEGHEFDGGEFVNFMGDVTFAVFFVDDSKNRIALTIQNKPMHYIEREEELLIERITINGTTFEIFRNIEDYQVIWERNGWLYWLNAFLPLDEVMGIIER
jgi:hypothetical protein